MADTAIEWTDRVWNPTTGCDRVSPGCAHCYALTYAARLMAMGQPKYQRDGGKASGPGFGLTLHADALHEPMRWRKPCMVFVNSMSDLFHDDVPYDFIDLVFATMAAVERHTFQVLTKRPDRMRDYVLSREGLRTEPLLNVWLGVTVENRRFVHRADLLRQTPAAVRFISAEPLLGPLVEIIRCPCGGDPSSGGAPCLAISGEACQTSVIGRGGLGLSGIDWVIVGGESGPKHRPMRLEWARDMRDAALDTGTAFFFKQWGGHTPKAGGRELDGRTWSEFPAGGAGMAPRGRRAA